MKTKRREYHEKCHSCGARKKDVLYKYQDLHLIRGTGASRPTFICIECVEICNDIIAEYRNREENGDASD
jgi:hypothetical protein